MASAARTKGIPVKPTEKRTGQLPPLVNGDRLDQKAFHARYEAMPPETRAELIGGIVFMRSPAKWGHGRPEVLTIAWLMAYEEATPGAEVATNITVILGPENEPQPDVCMILLPEQGGQTRENAEGYMEGPPELLVEVALTTESLDLHGKFRAYEKAGVKEYLVVALRQKKVFWFVRRRGRFKELVPGPDGVLRSEVFPGLWLDSAALLRRDRARVLAIVRQGIASAEHAAFVAKLARQGG